MKIADPIDFKVHVAGRGQIRLIDIMRELSANPAGFPHRLYYRDNKDDVVCKFGVGEPYYVVTLDLGANRTSVEGFQPSVVAKEPIPYVTAWGHLYEYEPGKLFPWSKRRKDRPPAFGHDKGQLLFEVLGKAPDKGLRVKLPHKPHKEWVLMAGWIWLDRPPTKLELRLRELRLDNPFGNDHRHPLYAADWLLNYALKERWTLTYDGDRAEWLATERWDDERQHEDLGIDEAIIALQCGILTEDRSDWGALSDDLVRQYVAADWGRNAREETIRQMTDLWLIERRMIKAAMQTASRARQMYAHDAFDRLLS